QYMLAHSQAGDAAALVQHRYRWAVDYYLRGHGYPLVPVDLYQFSDPSYNTGGMTPPPAASELLKTTSLRVMGFDAPDSQELNHQTEAWLGTFLRPIEEKSFFAVRLIRFAPPA